MAAFHGKSIICRQIGEFIRKRIREQLCCGYRIRRKCLSPENEGRYEQKVRLHFFATSQLQSPVRDLYNINPTARGGTNIPGIEAVLVGCHHIRREQAFVGFLLDADWARGNIEWQRGHQCCRLLPSDSPAPA